MTGGFGGGAFGSVPWGSFVSFPTGAGIGPLRKVAETDDAFRIVPVRWTPSNGLFVLALGSDTPGRFASFIGGDAVKVAQSGNFGKNSILRMTGHVRGPSSMPAGTRWIAELLIDSVVYAQREILPGRETDLFDMGANVASLATGDHEVALRLRFEDILVSGEVFEAEIPAWYVDDLRFYGYVGDLGTASVWGADFELVGEDCPLGPGVWTDRIGGLPHACYGTGDWFLTANGGAGVTKADVCYADFPQASAGKCLNESFGSDYRTVALILESTDTGFIPAICANWTGTDIYTGNCSNRIMGYHSSGYQLARYGNGNSLVGGAFPSYSRPRTGSGGPYLVAFAVNNTNNGYVFASTSDAMVWAPGLGGGAPNGGAWQSGHIFRRCAYYSAEIPDTTVRDLAITRLAAGPGIVSPALLQAWASANGVVFL